MNPPKYSHVLIGAALLLVIVEVCLVVKNHGQTANPSKEADQGNEKLTSFSKIVINLGEIKNQPVSATENLQITLDEIERLLKKTRNKLSLQFKAIPFFQEYLLAYGPISSSTSAKLITVAQEALPASPSL